MKNAETKTTTSHLQIQTQQEANPFFGKEGEATFFSEASNAIQAKPFFSPNAANNTDSPSNKEPFFSPTTIQAKSASTAGRLTIGQSNDKYEQEADAMADTVMTKLAQPESTSTDPASTPVGNTTTAIQPKCATCGEEQQLQKKEEEQEEISLKEETIQRKPIFESNEDPPTDNTIQRKCAACAEKEKVQKMETSEEEVVQQKTEADTSSASPDLQSQLNASKGGGSPLPKETTSSMGSAFGADFSGVKVHTGADAVQMNQGLGAQAFTHGSDIYFNEGKYDTGSSGGQHLLAHELTHTVQQGAIHADVIQRESRGDDEKNPLKMAKEEVTKYLEENNSQAEKIEDLPLNNTLIHLFAKVWKGDEVIGHYHMHLNNAGGKVLENIASEAYQANGGDYESDIFSVHGSEGLYAQFFLSGAPAEVIVVTASRAENNLSRLKEFAKKNAGFGGVFYNYPEEQAAMHFASLNPHEKRLIVQDFALLKDLSKLLDPPDIANGVKDLDLTLEEKLKLISGHLSSIEFQYLRPVLLASGTAGEKLHDQLDAHFTLSSLIQIPRLLGSEERFAQYLSRYRKRDFLIGTEDLVFDDVEGDLNVTLTPDESMVFSNIIKDQKAYDDISDEDRQTVLTAFQRNALKVTYQMLDLSEQFIIDRNEELLEGEAQKLIGSLNDSKSVFDEIKQLRKEKNERIDAVHHNTLQPETEMRYNEVMKRENAQFDSTKKRKEQDLAKQLSPKHPMLLSPDYDLEELYDDFVVNNDATGLKEHFLQDNTEKFANIQETRKMMREEPEQVFKLEGVVAQTKQLMMLPSPVFNQTVDEEVERIEWNEWLFSVGLAIISIGLAIASFGSLSPLALALVAGTSFIVSVADVHFTYKNYQFESTTGNTSIDPENALAFSDPSIIWVIASIAGVVADVVSLVKVVSKARLLRFAKTGEGATEIAQILKVNGLLEEGVDVMARLQRAKELKSAVKARLLTLSEGKAANLQEIDELSDIYLAQRFNLLDEAADIDIFLKADIDKWFDAAKALRAGAEVVEEGTATLRSLNLAEDVIMRLGRLTRQNPKVAQAIMELRRILPNDDVFKGAMIFFSENVKHVDLLPDVMKVFKSGNITDLHLIVTVLEDRRLQAALSRTADNPAKFSELWENYKVKKISGANYSFLDYVGYNGISTKLGTLDGLTIAAEMGPTFKKLTKGLEQNLAMLAKTETNLANELAKTIDETALPKHVYKKLHEVLGADLIGDLSRYNSASRKIIEKVNKTLRQSIETYGDFKSVMKLSQQGASRGSIGEKIARKFNIPPGAANGTKPSINTEGLSHPDWPGPKKRIIIDNFLSRLQKIGEVKVGTSWDLNQFKRYNFLMENQGELIPRLINGGIPGGEIKGISYSQLPGPDDILDWEKAIMTGKNIVDPVQVKALSKWKKMLEIVTDPNKLEVHFVTVSGIHYKFVSGSATPVWVAKIH